MEVEGDFGRGEVVGFEDGIVEDVEGSYYYFFVFVIYVFGDFVFEFGVWEDFKGWCGGNEVVVKIRVDFEVYIGEGGI